jgi:drug/metabolite transporter (DMT)-like permease
LIATLLVGVAFIFYQVSLKFFPLIDVKALVNLNVVFTVTFAAMILKEKISRREIIGIISAIVGIIVVGLNSQPSETSLNTQNYLWVIISFAIVISIGLVTFYKFKLNQEKILPFLASLSLIIGGIANKILLQSINSWDLLTLISLMQNINLDVFIISYASSLLFYVIGLSSGARVSVFSVLTSIFSTALSIIAGIVIFNEVITLGESIGLGLIFVGLVCIYSIRAKESYW